MEIGDPSLAEAEEPGITPFKVIGSNTMANVTDYAAMPYAITCKLYVTYRDGLSGAATGFVAGKGYVMTAGHVLYNHDKVGGVMGIGAKELGPALSIKVVLAENGCSNKGTRTSTSFDIPSEWKNGANKDYDYGMIKNVDFGWAAMGYTKFTTSFLNKSDAMIHGYAIDQKVQKYAKGKLLSYSGNQIKYKIDTLNGQSGGPITYPYGNNATCFVGIHSYAGGALDSHNYGVAFNQKAIDYIQKFVKG